MAQNRYYSSTAVGTTLVSGITSGATNIVVAAATAFPVSLPFTLILERDTANEEVVSVTGVAGTTFTVTRAQDGTAGVAHATGAVVEHGVSARDFNEPQAHMAASSAVHGIAGAVVGTTDNQTLTNKTLNGATLDSTSTIGGVSGTTLSSDHAAWTTFSPTVNGATAVSNGFGAYKLIGKTLFLKLYIGTLTGTGGAVTVTLPFALTAHSNPSALQSYVYVGTTNGVRWSSIATGSAALDLGSYTNGVVYQNIGVNTVLEVN